jgi:macrolide-specific efflux system membrane fusion protein
MRWKMPVAILLLAVGAGAVVFAITGGPGGSRAAGPQYLTANAAQGDVAQTVDATGSLSRASTYALDFGVAPAAISGSASGGSGSGTWSVKEVKVAVGDAVKKGAVLASADTSSLARDLKSAQSSLKAAKSQRTIAKNQYDDATGTDARRQARIGFDNADSQYVQAQGKVSDLEKQIARATIVAPVDGTVTAITAVAGTDLASGPAITLASGPLQVTADFTETDLPSLKLDQPATVTIDAIGAAVPGKVVAIAPSAASSSGSVVTYSVTIELNEPPAAARPGMSAKAAVTTAEAAGVISVPAVALNGSAPSYTVLVVGADGSTESRNVTVGLVTSSQAEIQSGLQAGEAVVIGTTAALNQTTTTSGGFGLPGGGGFQRGAGGGNGGGNNGGGGTRP